MIYYDWVARIYSADSHIKAEKTFRNMTQDEANRAARTWALSMGEEEFTLTPQNPPDDRPRRKSY